jgi:hypothetical protein
MSLYDMLSHPPDMTVAIGNPTGTWTPAKRTITPSREQPSANRSAHAPASKSSRCPTVEAGEADETGRIPRVLSGINLRGTSINPLKGEILQALKGIFPSTTNIAVGNLNAYLYFGVRQMPDEPWPLTVCGVPITIGADDATGRGPLFPLQNIGMPGVTMCDELDARKAQLTETEFRHLARAVVKQFRENYPNIRLVEVMLTSDGSMFIVVRDEVDISMAVRATLPGKVARCITVYMKDCEFHRPKWADRKAQRVINPQPVTGVIDTTAYDVVRPGVMITSTALRDHGHPATYATTSGIFVQNAAGDPFMTAASHGIGEYETVLQPMLNAGKKIIGRAVHEIAFTDISLMTIADGVQWTNETFEDVSGAVPRFIRLLGEHADDEVMRYNEIYMNSAFTGNMRGLIVAHSIKLECEPPVHPMEEDIDYIMYKWVFTGQIEGREGTAPQLPDATCGSAIWDDDGIVQGFFHYHITQGAWAGFAATVSASEVVKAGYRLA